MSSGNSGGADYIDNSNIFFDCRHSQYKRHFGNKWGLQFFLATTWRDAGLNYIAFNGILALAATVLMGWVILRYAERPALSTAFLLIFPIFDNVIQKRWYPAMAIIIFAVAMLYKQPHSFKRNAAFVLLCLLAVQFHSGVLVYLSIPVFFLIKKKKPSKDRNYHVGNWDCRA
ncbi:EpsG family protein [Lacticaseibacillus pantheris]|uniref:EpsG family protein n=1 Tax=Lacticaseibacillus pantheris TaxID=171523 RepID=UPI000A496945